MEPSLYLLEGSRDEDQGRVKVLALHSITPRGRDVRCELAIQLEPDAVVRREGRDWYMGAVVFRSTGSQSDGFASNLAQIAERKTPANAKMPEQVVFAATVAEGSFAVIGKRQVDLFLWFELPFGFPATLRISPDEVWFAVDDDDDEAAIDCFAGHRPPGPAI